VTAIAVTNTFKNYFERVAKKMRSHKISWCSLQTNLRKNSDCYVTTTAFR